MAITHKNRSKLNNLNLSTLSASSLKGGEVIGSGGFGCIFKPGLKCKNKKIKERKNSITKLMKTKSGRKEYKIVEKFNHLLKKIPNYSRYFLVDDFYICKPDTLTETDLINYNEKCSALQKIDIYKDNINDKTSLDKLLALNMPYGGIDVGKYISKYCNDSTKMIELNNSLIKLLENGIIPMNEHHVFHCDLKASNLLAREETGILYTRLVDWGLSTAYTSGPIPKILSNRPFQYNVPFSNILFNSYFTKMYKSFLKKNKDRNKHDQLYHHSLRTFVINFVLTWVEKRGPGHLKTMNNIFKKLFENELKSKNESLKNELIEFDYTFYFIFDYITKILTRFTKDDEFDINAYFNQVFLKNIDLWGFVASYIPIIEDIIDTNKKLSLSQNEILEKTRDLMLILIDSSDHPINIHHLIEKLKSFNSSFSHFKFSYSTVNLSSSSSSSEYSSSTADSDKQETTSKSVSSRTKKEQKNKHFHKMIVKTLKNIKTLHGKKLGLR